MLWAVLQQGFNSTNKEAVQKPAYLNAFGLIGVLSQHAGLVIVTAFHLNEAVGGVANTAGQNLVLQHGVDHCALAIGCSEKEKIRKQDG